MLRLCWTVLMIWANYGGDCVHHCVQGLGTYYCLVFISAAYRLFGHLHVNPRRTWYNTQLVHIWNKMKIWKNLKFHFQFCINKNIFNYEVGIKILRGRKFFLELVLEVLRRNLMSKLKQTLVRQMRLTKMFWVSQFFFSHSVSLPVLYSLS